MATDSTELTFVRCPSCRSLVPAVSTRCRMCGATLDNGADAAGQESGSPKSGRVRQRTISQSRNELTQTANRIRDEEGVVDEIPSEPTPDPVARKAREAVLAAAADSDLQPQPKPVTTQAPPAVVSKAPAADKIDQEFDPLSGYVEEVALDDESLDDLGDDDDLMDELLEEPTAPPMKTKEPGAPIKPAPISEPRVESPKIEVPAATPINGRGAASKSPQSPKESPPRVRPESGSRSGGVSNSPKLKGEEQMKEANDSSREADISRREQTRGPVPGSSRPAVRPPVINGADAGRLAGWFVSFSNPTGVSTELREGKFFVSRSQLKPSDYVVDDPSVSTPHAMVSVTSARSGTGVVHVQDLLSEKGIMFKHYGQGNFQRAQDSVELGHGDVVRFGDVEYLVCLISE